MNACENFLWAGGQVFDDQGEGWNLIVRGIWGATLPDTSGCPPSQKRDEGALDVKQEIYPEVELPKLDMSAPLSSSLSPRSSVSSP